jgi:hypothetical protein
MFSLKKKYSFPAEDLELYNVALDISNFVGGVLE